MRELISPMLDVWLEFVQLGEQPTHARVAAALGIDPAIRAVSVAQAPSSSSRGAHGTLHHPRGSARMTTMTTSPLDVFAEQYRLRIIRDTYGTRIIAGRGGSLISEYGDGRLTVLLMGTRAKWWGNRRRALIAAGARLEQDGDAEGSLSFDSANVTACALAIKAAGCKRRRVLSEAHRQILVDHGSKTRFQVAKTDDRRADGLSPLPDASDAA